MRCSHCQGDVAPTVETCPHCGTPLDSEPTLTFVSVTDGSHPEVATGDPDSVAGLGGFGLVVERGPRAGMAWQLEPGTTSVGRQPDSDIFLDDITVSRHHCRFEVVGDLIRVEDAGSTNGTYVNGDRVDRAVLTAGDEVIIGKFHLLVAHGDG